MVELCTHSATERAGTETLDLRASAPMPYPTSLDQVGLKSVADAIL